MKIALCIIQSILFFALIKKVYKKDKAPAVFMGAIFIYSIFSELNLALYPEFVARYVNLKKDIWLEYYLFITLSFVFLYFFDTKLMKVKQHFNVHVMDSEAVSLRLSNIVVIGYSAVLLIAIITIIRNWSLLSYSNNVLRRYSAQISFVRRLNDWNVYYFLIMLAAIKHNENKSKKIILTVSCALCVIALVLFTLGNGDRSVIVLCFVGWFVYYFYNRPLNYKSVRKMIPLIVIAMVYLFAVRIFRSHNTMSYDPVKTILQDDYAYPGFTLMAAINDAFIHPLAVIRSFITKGSVVLHGEYLYWVLYKAEFPAYIQQAISTGANPGIGFHLFTEGYIFAGFLGFLYNGFFISILLRFWRHFYTTEDEQTNIVIASIAAGIFVIGVRSESAYFVRNFIFYMLPAIILYMIVCDKRLRFSFETGAK